MSGSKRKSSASSDFKRIKAKVGKKAQRQNDTDVSFQSASLHLGQSIQQNNEPQKSGNVQLLLSSRGKFLYDLASTASTHPAAAARASSLKGVLDIVKNHPTDALLPNLSTLIPACVHSCVDEDQDVRSVGIDVLSALLSKLQENRIQPFGALLIARVSSALHSLDASTRIDGVKMAKIISTTCPSLTDAFVVQLLPPFCGLLADQRTRKALDEILQSLISVLRVTMTKYPGTSATMPTGQFASHSYANVQVQGNRKNDYKPDLIYIPGGRSRNAVLRTGRLVHDSPNTIESISHISRLERPTGSSFNVDRKIINRNKRQKSRDDGLGIKYKTSLMSKLRDSLIESINLEHEPTMASTNRMARSSKIEPQGSMNHSRVILLLRSIRYLHKSFAINNAGDLDDDNTEFDKFTQQIVAVLMDIFPIDQDPSAITAAKDTKSMSVDDVNAAIAITILDVSHEPRTSNGEVENTSAVLKDDSAKHWMKTICSYVIPRINHLVEAPSATSSSDLDITCKILRRLGMDSVFAADLDFVLGILQGLFFRTKDIQLARSTAGRRISLIVMDLIEDTNFSLGKEPMSPISDAFIQFVMMMPFYLEAWAADFIYESQRILKSLHKLVREVKEICNSPVLEYVRDSWYKLVTDRDDSSSTFEMYPCHLQKMYLGLMVLLRNPSDQTLTNLASISGRSTLNSDIFIRKEATGQAIVEAVQKIRKTVPMQRYLAFLIQSVGISRHVKEVMRFETIAADANLDLCSKNIFDRAFFTADSALNRVARVLIESGSMQVLRMIVPQLCSWQQTKVGEGGSSMEFLLKARASYIILAYFFLLHSTKKKNQLDDQSSIFDLTHGVMSVDTLTHSIYRFIHCIVRNEEAMKFSSKLTSPLVAIFSSQHVVLNAVIRKITDWFRTAGLSKTEQNNVLLILVDWMNDPRLKDVLTGSSSSITMIQEQIHTISRSEALQDNELVLNLVSLLPMK